MKQTNPVFHRQQAAAFQNTAEVQPRSAGRSASYHLIQELRLSAFRERLFYRQSHLPECLRSLRLFERSICTEVNLTCQVKRFCRLSRQRSLL